MITVGVYDAKARLSQLIEQVAHGEEVTITSGQRPLARLVSVQGTLVRRNLGDPQRLREISKRRLQLMAQHDPDIPPYDLNTFIEEARED